MAILKKKEKKRKREKEKKRKREKVKKGKREKGSKYVNPTLQCLCARKSSRKTRPPLPPLIKQNLAFKPKKNFSGISC